VPRFLSDEWFEALNSPLVHIAIEPEIMNKRDVIRVVMQLEDGPSGKPKAITLTLRPNGVSLEAGDHLAADTIIRLRYDDAEALTSGKLSSAEALRDGRVKVRGDIGAIVPLAAWLRDVHHALAGTV